MDNEKWLILYENMENNSRIYENIRLHLPNKDEQTIVKKNGRDSSYTMDWYKSQINWIDPELVEFLENQGLRKLDRKIGVNTFSVPKQRHNELKTDNNQLDYLRFKSLRNYFALIRLDKALSISEISDLRLTVEYRVSETDVEIFNKRTITKSLIDDLQYNEDVQFFFNIDKLDYRTKLPSYLVPLILNKLPQLENLQFNIKDRGPRRTSIKGRGYILDLDIYKSVAKTSEKNMLHFVSNNELKQEIDAIVKEFEERKIGA